MAVLALASTGFISLGGAVAPAAAAACGQFDVTGTWATQQSNATSVAFNFQQTGTALSGTAAASGASTLSGTLTGSMVGVHLDVVVSWNDGSQGHYVATVTQGALSGTTSGGGTSATWTGTGPTRCVTPTTTTTTVASTTTTTVAATTTTTRPTTTTTRPGRHCLPPPVVQPPPHPCLGGRFTCSLSQTHLIIIASGPSLGGGLSVEKIDIPLPPGAANQLAVGPSLSGGLAC